MVENWLPIPGFEKRYWVSDLGRVLQAFVGEKPQSKEVNHKNAKHPFCKYGHKLSAPNLRLIHRRNWVIRACKKCEQRYRRTYREKW
jgi:hypothetical protein